VEVKWFNRVRGYGFLKRPDALGGQDVFVHMETVRDAQLHELQPGERLEARIAPSAKGLTAVELRGLDDLQD
jgi:CspA family cold shock protein